jgi:AmmeMemoRadiSam system protein A
MAKDLSREDRSVLLNIARQSILNQLRGEGMPDIKLENYSSDLQAPGACFVTLTKKGVLRGCVGSIEATQALVLDVRDRAVGAAFHDYRFPSLTEPELDQTRIEISCLTRPEELVYSSPEDLIEKLRPGVDGVILRFGSRRATFLPQVWEQLPGPEDFLTRLCLKMGLDQTAWRRERLGVEIYQAEKFQEGV